MYIQYTNQGGKIIIISLKKPIQLEIFFNKIFKKSSLLFKNGKKD